MVSKEPELVNVVCPYCGYRMPVKFASKSNSVGVFLTCKGRSCKQVFHLHIKDGVQIK